MQWLRDDIVHCIRCCFIIGGRKFWITLLRRVDTAFVGCIESERICERACVVLKNKTFGLVVCEWGLIY